MIVPSPLRRAIAVFALALALLASCSSDDGPTDEELRRERIENRLTASFPRNQATCILDGLDGPALVALDRDADLTGKALETYSRVVRSCVEDPTAGATTTTAPESDPTTTAPAGDG